MIFLITEEMQNTQAGILMQRLTEKTELTHKTTKKTNNNNGGNYGIIGKAEIVK